MENNIDIMMSRVRKTISDLLILSSIGSVGNRLSYDNLNLLFFGEEFEPLLEVDGRAPVDLVHGFS